MTSNLGVKSSAAALAWMMACVGSVLAQKADLPVLRIQEYPGAVSSVPGWVAADAGFCEANGIKCEFVTIPSGPLGLQALAAKSIEVSFASTDVAMASVARGNDVQLIVGTHPNNIFSLSVRADVPLPRRSEGYPGVMKDFKGLRVGVTARGSAVEIQMRALLMGAGIDPDSVTFVAVGSPNTAYPTMVAKQVDAVLMFEPLRVVCVKQKTCISLFDFANGEGPDDLRALNGGFQNYVSRRDFIRTNGKEIDAFIRAISEAVSWLKDPQNIEKVIAITERHMSLGDIKDAKEILRELVKSQIPLYGSETKRSTVKSFSDFLLKYNLINKPVDPNSFVYAKAP